MAHLPCTRRTREVVALEATAWTGPTGLASLA